MKHGNHVDPGFHRKVAKVPDVHLMNTVLNGTGNFKRIPMEDAVKYLLKISRTLMRLENYLFTRNLLMENLRKF